MIRLETADEAGGSCLNRGRHVTERFSAVYGDDHDRVHRCLGCDCFRRVSKGSAAGVDVDLADPAEDPNRNRGQRVGAAHTDGGSR
jgi:hypothetical protein